MKTKVKRVLALALALTLVLALPVYAAGNSLNYSVYAVEAKTGYTLTPQTAEGKTDSAVTEDVNGDGTSDSAYKNTVKFQLTFNGKENVQYVVFLLSDGAKVPTQTSIRYSDQKGAGTEKTVAFTIYPDTLDKAGDYTVFLSSSGENGTYAEVGSFKVASLYTLGDVNQDGSINSADALLVLQFSVGNIFLNNAQQKAADVNCNNSIDSADALKILQYSVGIITDFN